jgi:hypothetical protein
MLKRVLLIGLSFGLVSCASHYVIVPPVMDLMTVEPVGLILFSVENAKGELDQMATQAFLQEATGYQKVPVLEIGKLEDVLGKLGLKALDQDAARAIGERYKLKSFFFGDVKVSRVKRQVDVGGVLQGNLRIRASLDISVTGRLISTETGATLWTSSSNENGTLALMSLGEDLVPYFGVRDQDEATRTLLHELMFDLTWDFRPTKRRI